MFSLEKAVAHWRQEMRDAGLEDPAVLDELESHLRDAIKIRLHAGLTEREAFTVSSEELGPTERLKREFAALRPDLRIWLVYGIVTLYSLVAGGPAVSKLGSFSDVTSAQQLSAIAAVAVTALLILGGRVFARAVPVIPNRRIRLAIYGSGAVSVLIWLVIFYYLIMTRLEWNVSELVVGILWSWVPMAALCGTIFGMEYATERRMEKAHV